MCVWQGCPFLPVILSRSGTHRVTVILRRSGIHRVEPPGKKSYLINLQLFGLLEA